jgi:hypothetical protein
MRILLDSCCDGDEGGNGDLNTGHNTYCHNFPEKSRKEFLELVETDILVSFNGIDYIYNNSFNPKTGKHDKSKRQACAEFLKLPINNPTVDIYYLCYKYRGGQPDAIKYRLSHEI